MQRVTVDLRTFLSDEGAITSGGKLLMFSAKCNKFLKADGFGKMIGGSENVSSPALPVLPLNVRK